MKTLDVESVKTLIQSRLSKHQKLLTRVSSQASHGTESNLLPYCTKLHQFITDLFTSLSMSLTRRLFFTLQAILTRHRSGQMSNQAPFSSMLK